VKNKGSCEARITHPECLLEFGNTERDFFKEMQLGRLLKMLFFPGWSKMHRCKAPEILRSEAYFRVRRNNEG